MSHFRCYLLNAENKIVSVASVEAEGDSAAMEMAAHPVEPCRICGDGGLGLRGALGKPDREASLGFAPQDIVAPSCQASEHRGQQSPAAMMP